MNDQIGVIDYQIVGSDEASALVNYDFVAMQEEIVASNKEYVDLSDKLGLS